MQDVLAVLKRVLWSQHGALPLSYMSGVLHNRVLQLAWSCACIAGRRKECHAPA